MSNTGFGVRVRTLRMKKGLSLQQLADKVEATKAHIWEMEQGRSQNPSLALLTNLARALDVSIKDLVGEGDASDAEKEQLGALFRDLRGLAPDQLDLIRTMTDKLREMKSGNKPEGGSQ